MGFNLKEYENEFLFVPLGGSNEIGMNLNLYHYKGKWLIIDCGIGFAGEYIPGVDIIIPDISFITKYKKDIVGMVITHAHEDHLGAVPHLWEELGCPLYATSFTASILRAKLADEGLNIKIPLHEVKPGQKINLAPFEFEMIPLTHSIPEMQAIALRTEKGVVMHTGDWKFDPDPVVGNVSDIATLKKYGDEGILAMVCDSTNIYVDGESGSEAGVKESLAEIIAGCKQRVVVTTFASNIARIESIVSAAKATGRHIAIAGRSLRRVTTAARENGYLQDVEFINEREIGNFARNDILIICTGCQGEPMAALSKVARHEHPNIKLAAGDTVIFSSRKIPGNESKVAFIYNALTRRNIEMVTAKRSHVHVSGHPCRDELKAMYEYVRPKIAIPTHGETRHIHEHAKFAKALGVKEVPEAKNGSVILLAEGRALEIGTVESGYIAIDGNSFISIDSPVIKARRRLRDEGCFIVHLVLDKHNQLLTKPFIASQGSLDATDDKDLLSGISDDIKDLIADSGNKGSNEKMAHLVKSFLQKTFKQELGKRPIIEVQVTKI